MNEQELSDGNEKAIKQIFIGFFCCCSCIPPTTTLTHKLVHKTRLESRDVLNILLLFKFNDQSDNLEHAKLRKKNCISVCLNEVVHAHCTETSADIFTHFTWHSRYHHFNRLSFFVLLFACLLNYNTVITN